MITLREKREVEVKNRQGKWITTTGIFNDEDLCDLPDCNRLTRSRNRVRQVKLGHKARFCSRDHHHIYQEGKKHGKTTNI